MKIRRKGSPLKRGLEGSAIICNFTQNCSENRSLFSTFWSAELAAWMIGITSSLTIQFPTLVAIYSARNQ